MTFLKLGSTFFFGAEKNELSDLAVVALADSAFAVASFLTTVEDGAVLAGGVGFFAGGAFEPGVSADFRFFGSEGPASVD